MNGRRAVVRLGLGMALAWAACRHRPEQKLNLPTTGPVPRLAWVTWPDPNAFIFCTRRLDDNAAQVGVPGPCWRLEAGEAVARKIFEWASLGGADHSPSNASPWDRCHFETEQGVLAPKPTPARLWLLTPTRRDLVVEWMPDVKAQGDVFVLEPSFSPEGKWMAIVRVGVGLGEGERIVEIDSAELRLVPACR